MRKGLGLWASGFGQSVLVLAAMTAAAGTAHAEDTFEGKTVDARYIKKIEDVVWPLVATCEKGDDTEQRQCRHVRDARAQTLRGATLLVDGDVEAWSVGAYNASRKSVPVSLTPCLRCGGIDIDGRTVFVLGLSGQSSQIRFEGGRLRPAPVHDSSRSFSDENAAAAWAKSVRKVRVQFLVKVPDKPRWTVQGRDGVSFEVLGYRVISPCDGQIVMSQPTSQAVDPDKKACRADDSEGDQRPGDGGPPDQLSESMIQEAMKPVVEAADTCHERFGVAGKAKLLITIAGDGTVVKADQSGDFVDTPTGLCIEKAVRRVTFPQSKKARTTIGYPIVLR
jgi:hypothetical protein